MEWFRGRANVERVVVRFLEVRGCRGCANVVADCASDRKSASPPPSNASKPMQLYTTPPPVVSAPSPQDAELVRADVRIPALAARAVPNVYRERERHVVHLDR